MRPISLALAVAVAVAGLGLVLPGTAAASKVSVTFDPLCEYGRCYDDLLVSAPPGERNTMTLSTLARTGGWAVAVEDATAPLSAGRGCRSTGAHRAACEMTDDDYLEITTIELGDRDDRLNASSFGWPITAYGGRGDDTLRGGPEPDTLAGGPGLNVLDGGGDEDTALFDGKVRNLRVDLGDAGAQGGTRSRDVMRAIEDVSAKLSPGSELIGDAGPNVLAAGPRGMADGRSGADDLSAGEGGRLFGGPGPDLLSGGINEFSNAKEPLRLINCGHGRDTVASSALPDLVTPGCEKIEPAGGAHAFVGLVRSPKAGSPFVTLSYNCVGYPSCPLETAARADSIRGEVLARRRDQVPDRSFSQLPLTLNARGRALLAERGRMRVVVYYRRGPSDFDPRWQPPTGFSTVLEAPSL